jgi:BirA family biotin operon repressor/biotin-[acetyl-CoA-carboxylase] ligase
VSDSAAALPPGLSRPYAVTVLAEIDSTNDEARRRAAEGAPDGTVIVAERQTAGRGRQGRSWDSPPGNLHMSILIRPDLPVSRMTEAAFVAGVAAAEAIERFLPEGRTARCKWPNDVLVDGRKIAGLLAEGAVAPDGRADHIVVGIGVNVAWHPERPDYPTTSLKALGAEGDAAALRDAILAAWDRWRARWEAAGFAAIRGAWTGRAHALGQTVEIRREGAPLRGRFAGIDRAGALLLDTVAGKRETCHFGDIAPPKD